MMFSRYRESLTTPELVACIIIGLQLVIPLRYYVIPSWDPLDEDLCWRMFSQMLRARVHVSFDGLTIYGEPFRVLPEKEVAELVKRYGRFNIAAAYGVQVYGLKQVFPRASFSMVRKGTQVALQKGALFLCKRIPAYKVTWSVHAQFIDGPDYVNNATIYCNKYR